MTNEGSIDDAQEEAIGEFCVRFSIRKLTADGFNWRADIRRPRPDGSMPTGLGFWNTSSTADSQEDARRAYEIWRDATLKRIF